ncbi:MAG: hypothetical protein KTR32_13620 [Granulosicoccus sp.]|nr:hypothetical protein [Granulosicoccus sp.]
MKILIGLDPRSLHTSMPWELARRFQEIDAELHWVFAGDSSLADHYTVNGDFLAYPADQQLHEQQYAGKILFRSSQTLFSLARFAAWIWRLQPASYDLVLLQHGTALSRLFQLRQFRTITLGTWSENLPTGGVALPPIVDTRLRPRNVSNPYTMVYLPGVPLSEIEAILDRVEDRKFVVYTHDQPVCNHPNICVRQFEHARFREDLRGASTVICQPEFGLVAECLHMGIPLLIEPKSGQQEQQETAITLHKAGLVHSTRKLTPMLISLWLDSAPRPPVVHWPEVVPMIIEAISDSNKTYESLHRRSTLCWNNLPINLSE